MAKVKYESNSNFYVFYDKNDFVDCCGTVEDLVRYGYFPSSNAVHSCVSKIKAGKIKRNVVILPLVDKKE